jgi:hypothetical protein
MKPRAGMQPVKANMETLKQMLLMRSPSGSAFFEERLKKEQKKIAAMQAARASDAISRSNLDQDISGMMIASPSMASVQFI